MNYWLEIIYVGTLSTLLHHTDFILFMNLEFFRYIQIMTIGQLLSSMLSTI